MKKTILIYLSFVFICLSSCREYKEITFSGIEKVTITTISQNGVDAEISVRIKNPNKFSFLIYKSNLDVKLSDISVGKADLLDKVKIKANSEDSYILNIHSDFSNLAVSDFPKLFAIAMSKRLKIATNGSLRVGKFFYKKTVPVDITADVPLDQN